MVDATDDFIVMNMEQARKVPFPPSSLVYIYNQESPAYAVGAGIVKAVHLKWIGGASCETLMMFKVKMMCMHGVYGENTKSVLLKASQLRFRNGCPVNVKMQMQSFGDRVEYITLPGIILGICDVPTESKHEENKDCDLPYRYSIQVFENNSHTSLSLGKANVLQNVRAQHVQFREVTLGAETTKSSSYKQSGEKVAVSNFVQVKEEPQDTHEDIEEPKEDAILSNNGSATTDDLTAECSLDENSIPTMGNKRVSLSHWQIAPATNDRDQNSQYPDVIGSCSQLGQSLPRNVGRNNEHGTLNTSRARLFNDRRGRIEEVVSRNKRNQDTASTNATNVSSPSSILDSGLKHKRKGIHTVAMNSKSKPENDQNRHESRLKKVKYSHGESDSYISSTSRKNDEDSHGKMRLLGKMGSTNSGTRQDKVHWRYVPPGKSERKVKNIGEKRYYWLQEGNAGKGMWSLHYTMPDFLHTRKIHLPDSSKDEIFHAIIGSKGIKHRKLLKLTDVEALKLLGRGPHNDIVVESKDEEKVESAVNLILKTLRRELNSSLRDAVVSMEIECDSETG